MRVLRIGLVGCALALTACELTPKPNMVSYIGQPMSAVVADKGMWHGLHRFDKDHIGFTWTRTTRYVTSQGGTMGRKACHSSYITAHNGGPQENWRDFIVVDQRKKCGIVG